MPNLRTAPIYTDQPGALPAEYVIPGTLELVVQSIVARFNGAAAGAAFLPTLSIYTQDGRLVTRCRPDQEFAVGDTGVVTFAPFLRRAATPAAGVVLGGGYFLDRGTNTAVASGGVVDFSVLTGGTNTFVVDSDGTHPFDHNPAATPISLVRNGYFGLFFAVKWVTAFAGDRYAEIVLSSGVDFPGTPLNFARSRSQVTPDGDFLFVYLPCFVAASTGSPVTLALNVSQTSGVSRDVDAISFVGMHYYLT